MKRKSGNDLTTQTLLDFDLGESSSDSDFRIEDHDDDSDDFSANSKDEDDGDGDDDDDDGDDDDDASDDGEDEEDATDSGTTGSNSKVTELPKPGVLPEKPVSLEEMLKKTVKGVDKATLKLLSTPICCACLGDRSDDQNEIVECDGCGVTVHEGCYGVSESTSISSTISSCSTEPWFCEACKAGIADPDCELCPNKGGIFKETDVGKWVHLVCALYVPGVAFGEVDQLSSVTLFEMPYNKWGAKTCSLCDDAKFARTGVCIGCDAGMCKTYFHVTCAQYAGLLSEAHSEEADQADPFYAHCKIHSDKTLIKHRKRNYNAIRLKAHNRKLEQEAKKLEKPSPEQVRIERKLAKHRKKYVNHKETKNPPWVPTQKMPRLLTTSATACKKLLMKAELMGIDTAAMEFQEAQMTALADVRKKWHIPPAFSVEFIGYYLDRTVRLKEIKKTLQEQVTSNQNLLEEQQRLRDKYDSAMKVNQEALNQNDDLKDAIKKLYDDIHALCPSKALIPIEQIGKPPSVPPIQNPNVIINTPSSTPPARTITVPTAAALKMGVGFPLQNLIAPGKRDDTGRILSTQCKQNSEELLNECGICKRCSDQHLLAKCDTCHLYYHLGCLNPPLTRHPKKSKLYGWQCSECDKSDDSGPEHVILPKAPRKSRTRYSKDGIIVPYDMPSPEFERSPESASKRPRRSGPSGNTSATENSPTKTALTVAVVNGIETKEVVLEIPKIDLELADKLSSGETSIEIPVKVTAKRGRKKKSIETAVETINLIKEEVTEAEIKKEAPPPIEPTSKVSEVPKDERPKPEPAEANPKETKKEKKKEKQKSQLTPTPDAKDDPTSVPKPSAEGADSVSSGSSRETIPTATESTSTVSAVSAESIQPPTEPTVPLVPIPPAAVEAETLTTGAPFHSHSHKHSKRKKEKHRNRSPHEDGSPTKEHKRKRKRKNHDIENPNDASGSGGSSAQLAVCSVPSDDNRPRIKIKIKSVLDGSNTHTIFYVPNDSIEPPRPSTSSEPVVTSTPLTSPANVSVTKIPSKPDPIKASSSAAAVAIVSPTKSPAPAPVPVSVSAPIIGAKPPPVSGRGRGRRLSIIRPNRASTSLNSSSSVGNNSSAAGGESMCDVCHTPGSTNNIVQCDECHKNYHFGCLDPPVKKSPKRRGYSWHCADCDPTDAIKKLYDDIHALCPSKALIPIEQIGKPPSVPPIQNPNVIINTPSSTPPARTITVPTAAALKMGVGFPLQNLIAPGKRDDTGRILSTQCKQNSEELLNECGICKRCSDQHLLAKCDTCHLYYHLGCLNPPLTRHPKKSKLYGWQCSECDKSDDSGPEHVILPKAPRKSRTRYSKDGIIVPYDMPSPEFERSPESASKRPRRSGPSGNTSATENSPTKTALTVAVVNGIETKEVVLEIPKIDLELADKLSSGETSIEIPVKVTAKRGRKKKSIETAVETINLIKEEVTEAEIKKEAPPPIEPTSKVSEVPKDERPKPEPAEANPKETKKEKKKEKQKSQLTPTPDAKDDPTSVPKPSAEGADSVSSGSSRETIPTATESTSTVSAVSAESIQPPTEPTVPLVPIPPNTIFINIFNGTPVCL